MSSENLSDDDRVAVLFRWSLPVLRQCFRNQWERCEQRRWVDQGKFERELWNREKRIREDRQCRDDSTWPSMLIIRKIQVAELEDWDSTTLFWVLLNSKLMPLKPESLDRQNVECLQEVLGHLVHREPYSHLRIPEGITALLLLSSRHTPTSTAEISERLGIQPTHPNFVNAVSSSPPPPPPPESRRSLHSLMRTRPNFVHDALPDDDPSRPAFIPAQSSVAAAGSSSTTREPGSSLSADSTSAVGEDDGDNLPSQPLSWRGPPPPLPHAAGHSSPYLHSPHLVGGGAGSGSFRGGSGGEPLAPLPLHDDDDLCAAADRLCSAPAPGHGGGGGGGGASSGDFVLCGGLRSGDGACGDGASNWWGSGDSGGDCGGIWAATRPPQRQERDDEGGGSGGGGGGAAVAAMWELRRAVEEAEEDERDAAERLAAFKRRMERLAISDEDHRLAQQASASSAGGSGVRTRPSLDLERETREMDRLRRAAADARARAERLRRAAAAAREAPSAGHRRSSWEVSEGAPSSAASAAPPPLRSATGADREEGGGGGWSAATWANVAARRHDESPHLRSDAGGGNWSRAVLGAGAETAGSQWGEGVEDVDELLRPGRSVSGCGGDEALEWGDYDAAPPPRAEILRLEARRRVASNAQAARMLDPIGAFRRDLLGSKHPDVMEGQVQLEIRSHADKMHRQQNDPSALRHVACVLRGSQSVGLRSGIIHHTGFGPQESKHARRQRLEKYTERGLIRPCAEPTEAMKEAYSQRRLRGTMLDTDA